MEQRARAPRWAFGHALVNVDEELNKRPFFVISVAYSDNFFVQVIERENTETFWEGHVRAFRFFERFRRLSVTTKARWR